jgi:hypothetical protein
MTLRAGGAEQIHPCFAGVQTAVHALAGAEDTPKGGPGSSSRTVLLISRRDEAYAGFIERPALHSRIKTMGQLPWREAEGSHFLLFNQNKRRHS